MSGTIAVIVLSFNRPRMLAAALMSCAEADELVLADDGSEFDLGPLIDAAPPGVTVIQNPSLTPAQRMTTPTTGALINRAIREVRSDYLAVLCDDDLFAPGWLPVAAAFLDEHPEAHIVRGIWMRFNDGEPLDKADVCPLSHHPPITTGNFVQRTACATECGCWWDESTIAMHDAAFVDNYFRRHRLADADVLDVVAGYRREHPYNMLRWAATSHEYSRATEQVFAAGMLEP